MIFDVFFSLVNFLIVLGSDLLRGPDLSGVDILFFHLGFNVANLSSHLFELDVFLSNLFSYIL